MFATSPGIGLSKKANENLHTRSRVDAENKSTDRATVSL